MRIAARTLGGLLVCLLLSGGGEPVFGEDGVSNAEQEDLNLDLATLARLEQEKGNGGADDTFPMTAGWDKKHGFFISDVDKENFLLRIGGRIQLRYTYKGLDDDSTSSDHDSSYFELERLRVKFQGYVLDPALTYYVQLDGDTDGDGDIETVDAYILYKAGELFSDNPNLLAIGGGQWKPWFMRQEPNSSGKLQLVERSLTTEFFNIDRNLGIWVQGDLAPVFYSFAVTNGFDSINESTDDVDQIPAFIGKLDLNILGDEGGKYEESNIKCSDELLWTVGASFASDQNNGTRENAAAQFKCYSFGFDTILKYSIFSLQAEYVGRWLDFEDDPVDSSNNYSHGMYVQGGVFLLPQTLEVSARVSTVWGVDGVNDGNGWEAGPCLSWYISKSHKVKLQTDVMVFHLDDDMPVKTESLDDGADGGFSSSAADLESGDEGVMWRTQVQLEF